MHFILRWWPPLHSSYGSCCKSFVLWRIFKELVYRYWHSRCYLLQQWNGMQKRAVTSDGNDGIWTSQREKWKRENSTFHSKSSIPISSWFIFSFDGRTPTCSWNLSFVLRWCVRFCCEQRGGQLHNNSRLWQAFDSTWSEKRKLVADYFVSDRRFVAAYSKNTVVSSKPSKEKPHNPHDENCL